MKQTAQQRGCTTEQTLPGKGDEMTSWTEDGRKRVWRYFLIMYLKKGLCSLVLRKMIISAASLHSVTFALKMFFCQINPQSNSANAKYMKICFLSWRLCASTMKRIGGTQCCAIQSQIVTAEKTYARNVLMVKKIAPSKSLTSVVSYKQ